MKDFWNWELNPEIGCLYGSPVSNELFYTHLDGTGTTSLLNLGGRYLLSSTINPLGAVGRTSANPETTRRKL